MNELEKEATDLGTKADSALVDMGKVDREIKSSTMEMKRIADGLKSRMNDQEIGVGHFFHGHLILNSVI